MTAAQDIRDFMGAFFEGYPEYKPNGLYLTAESYGGIYIPMMADQIRKRPIPGVTLKGMAIGDGCWGTATGLCDFSSGKSHQIRAQFFAGHGMYDQPLFAKLQKDCGDWSNEAVQAKACVADLAEMNNKVGQYYARRISAEPPSAHFTAIPASTLTLAECFCRYTTSTTRAATTRCTRSRA